MLPPIIHLSLIEIFRQNIKRRVYFSSTIEMRLPSIIQLINVLKHHYTSVGNVGNKTERCHN